MDLERLSHLLASSDPETRSQAAKAAGESGDASSVRPLAARLKVEPEAKVRGALLVSIARFTTPEAINAIRAQAADPDPRNRCRVLEALYKAQDQTVFPLAVRMLSDLDAEVKGMAFQVVRRLGRDGVMQIISKMLSSDDVRWKVYAVAALGQVASTEGVAVLEKSLSHETPEVRLQARASLVNLAKHGNDAAAKALAAHEAANPAAADLNSTLVSTPIKAVPPQQPSGTDTLMVAPPGLRTVTGLQRPGAPGAAGAQPAQSRPAGMPTASALAGPPPVGGAPGASTIAKRPSMGAAGNKPNFVPLDEESLKIRTKPADEKPPPAKRYSTAKYKALFGESMPVIKPPAPEPEPEPEAAEEGEEGDPMESEVSEPETFGGIQMEEKREMTPEEAEYQRKKKSKHYKDNVCRDCVQYRKDRPDKAKLAQGRGWCSLLKKEVKSSHTCPRGKW